MYLKSLSRLRKEKKLTQEGLAGKAGISYHTLLKLESGRIKNPSIRTVIRIANALEIPIERLINDRGVKNG